jgi:GGDEF domain-containing protein
VRQSILDLIEQTRLPWQGEELHLSLSAGIATLSRETTAPEDLMAAADADMYRQKVARKANRPGPVVNNLCAPTPAPHAESW